MDAAYMDGLEMHEGMNEGVDESPPDMTLQGMAEKLTRETGRPVPGFTDGQPYGEAKKHYRGEQEMIDWWVKTAAGDIESSVEKVREYGGLDLLMLGQALYRWAYCPCKNWSKEPTDAFLQELGVYFYIQGKLGRSFSALAAGRMPSDDTVLDLDYYPTMIRRIRTKGSWPGSDDLI
jgi:hypothetical protein